MDFVPIITPQADQVKWLDAISSVFFTNCLIPSLFYDKIKRWATYTGNRTAQHFGTLSPSKPCLYANNAKRQGGS